jgi:prepilin-type N-terminal cleavage/methylation domain-containing protein
MLDQSYKAMDSQNPKMQMALYLVNYLGNLIKTRRSQESGFSLLESLVAVAVVSILIVAIAPMVALSTSARVNARRIDQATQAARSYVDAVRGGVIDTTSFPASLIQNNPYNSAKASQQYTFEAVVPPTKSPSLTASSSCQAVTNAVLVLATTTVLGTCVDANGNGFSVNDPQDLFVQPMRSGSNDATILKKQGFWLAVRVYRADALSGNADLRDGTEPICNTGRTAFASTASITCPIVTVRSQILPITNANNLDDIKSGIGSAP